MNNIIKSIQSYLNNTEMTNMGVIVTAVISAIVVVVLTYCWKGMCRLLKLMFSLSIKQLKKYMKRTVLFSRPLIRTIKRELTADEYAAIYYKKKDGITLTNRENRLYERNKSKHQKIKVRERERETILTKMNSKDLINMTDPLRESINLELQNNYSKIIVKK